MDFSKQFLEQLAGDLDTVADALDDAGQGARAETVWRTMRIVRSLVPDD